MPGTLIQFPTRAHAYAFAAELRRIVAFVETGTLRVHDTDCGHVVELPQPLVPYGGLRAMARRFEGHVASGETRERLGDAVARAETSADEASRARAGSAQARRV